MTKQEFMMELEMGLATVPADERVAALQYYTEYFDDAGPEHEAEVLAELGSPQQLAADIRAASGTEEYTEAAGGWTPPVRPDNDPFNLGVEPPVAPSPVYQSPNNIPPSPEYPQPLQEPRVRGQRSGGATAALILLAVFLSPLWIGLAGAVFGLAVAGLVLCAVPLIIGVAFTAAGLFALVTGVPLLVVSAPNGLVFMGLSLIILAVGILVGYFGVKIITRGAVGLLRGVSRLISNIFNRGGAQHA